MKRVAVFFAPIQFPRPICNMFACVFDMLVLSHVETGLGVLDSFPCLSRWYLIWQVAVIAVPTDVKISRAFLFVANTI